MLKNNNFVFFLQRTTDFEYYDFSSATEFKPNVSIQIFLFD